VDVMGESEVLICPNRHLEDIMVKLEELKIQHLCVSGSLGSASD